MQKMEISEHLQKMEISEDLQKMEISEHFLTKTSNLPLAEKLSKLASYLCEEELARHIDNYINMEKTYQQMSDQLLEAGLTIPNSKDFLSFFKNKILDIYYNDCHCEGDFINWLNN